MKVQILSRAPVLNSRIKRSEQRVFLAQRQRQPFQNRFVRSSNLREDTKARVPKFSSITCGFGRMAQASVFQTEYAGSIPAIHSKACNAKRSSEQSFTLSNSGFEPRARHQYPRAFPPKVSRINFDLDPYGMGLRCKRRSSRFDSERDLQWKRCKSAEHIVLKTTGVETLGSSSLPASSNALVGANSMFALLENRVPESRLARPCLESS